MIQGMKPKKLADRRKAGFKSIRIREQFVEPLEKLKERNGTPDLTQVVNDVVRQALEREGLWPVK